MCFLFQKHFLETPFGFGFLIRVKFPGGYYNIIYIKPHAQKTNTGKTYRKTVRKAGFWVKGTTN